MNDGKEKDICLHDNIYIIMGRSKGEPTVVFSLRMNEELKKVCTYTAGKEGYSLNEWINKTLREKLAGEMGESKNKIDELNNEISELKLKVSEYRGRYEVLKQFHPELRDMPDDKE